MKLIAAAVIAALAAPAFAASTHVDGYTRRDGTYVQPHMRTTPDESRMNNWSTQGNSNPYTGERGTVNPYSTPSSGGFGSSSPLSPGGFDTRDPRFR